MQWTSDKPTESGWYWMKDGSAMAVVQIEIGTFDGFYVAEVWQIGSAKRDPLSVFTGIQWSSEPIAEPKEPA